MIPFPIDFIKKEWCYYTDLPEYKGKAAALAKLESLHRVLICNTLGNGYADQLQITPVIRAINEAYPEKQIDVATWHQCIFDNNPRVGKAICFPPNMVPGPPKDIPEDCFALVPVAFQHYWDGLVLPTTRAFGWQVGLEITNTRQEIFLTEAEESIGKSIKNRSLPKGYVAIQSRCDPPADQYGREGSKRWMSKGDWYMERWDPVIRGIREMGYTPVQIGCMGDPKIEGIDRDMRKAGVRGTAAVIKHAALCICFDSLPCFLANAVGTHALTLWCGRTHPEWQGLENRTNIEMSKGLECEHCWVPHNRNDDCDRACMDRITSEIVLSHARKILENQD